MRVRLNWKMLVLGSSMAASAQAVIGVAPVQPQPQRPPVVGGTVRGHVYASDNQRPARFADVELVQENDENRNRGGFSGPGYNTQAHGRTALDGSFTIENVPPGDYYVVASMTGYVSPLQVARMNQTAIVAPQTHVSANGSSDVVVSIDRGAVVTGRVSYDDGAPIPGVSVRVALVSAPGNGGGMILGGSGGFGGGQVFFFGGGTIAQTDDRGVFRVMGVPAGKYVVSTTVQTESIGEGRATGAGGRLSMFRGIPPTLTVYAPATMHKAEAQTVVVHAGDVLDGVDIHVALNGLHTVKGVVQSKADSHPLNSGTVSLADASDNSTVRTTQVSEDGSFRMDYVPAGNYTLNVSGQDRLITDRNGGRRGPSSVKRYERATLTVTVGDHDAALDPVQLNESKTTDNATNQ